jgi:BirA family biotin operon repressor/biotin-[acetyl-CoA-carboxylase] ligase
MMSVALTFPSRLERVERVGSTNDVVMGWLRDGVPEVCVATADEQTAGRGRSGRSWTAPAGAALLASLGFTPTYLEPDHVWRLAAIVSLAMAEAGESTAGLEPGTIRLKWPNDLVIETDAVRKVAGVLGETEGLGTAEVRAVVGIGINAGWDRRDFPRAIADDMTSLSDAARKPAAAVDRERLVDAFLAGLEPRADALRDGTFDPDEWSARQLTNGRPVRLELPGGGIETVQALGVDPDSGALLVSNPREGTRRSVLVGEIRHLRLNDRTPGV